MHAIFAKLAADRGSWTMRQLIGKLPTKERGVVEEVYIAEQVRCRDCEKSSPMGVEVVTVRKDGKKKTVLKRAFFCQVHGAEYQSRAQGDR